MPKELYSIVENKWHYCLNVEKEIRQSTLAHVMLDLTKGQISKASKKHGRKFVPNYRAFKISQNNIENVGKQSTQMWKLIYVLTIVKQGEADPFEGRNNGEEEEESDKKEEGEKEKEDVTVDKETQKNDMATAEEQQQEHSV